MARFRSLFLGQKNSRGQFIGSGTLIDEAVVKYAEEHKEELNQYRKMLEVVKEKGGEYGEIQQS